MKINVTENKVSIKEEQILNENEYNIHKIQFDFSSEYTDDLVKVALFSIDNHTYKKIISNNECDIPPEVLTQRGYSILGVYAYKTEQDTLVLRYSPSPTKISVYDGSYKADAENSEPITPSEIEQYQQILQNSLQQFQNQYNALVEETEGDIQAIEDELQRKVDEGYFDGEDGFSPIAKVIQKSNGATIEIEDKNGKTTADVLNGEDGYTPVRGVDYWTEEDKQEVEEEATQQIEGKIEEYNENAAEKLNQYNQNSVQKTNDYNTNAEQKMSAYNTNATEKTSTYNSNATEKFNDYNSNAEQKETNYNTNASQKVESFNTNASSKLSEYNSNAETKKSAYDENATNKLTEYNTNHTEKMSAYNSNSTEKLNAFNENAIEKTEDFDEHTEEIQDNIEILQRTDNQILSRFNKDEEVSGQDITLTGTTEIKFAKPPLPMGNSEQESTTGTNLIGLDTEQYRVDLSEGDKLTITNNTSKQIIMDLYSNYGDTQRNDWFSFVANDTRTITLLHDTKAIAWRDAINGIAWCNSGETALPYEKYTGGEASPNPDYPQEITNVTGDVEVKVQNKNLFDKTKVITTNLGNWGVEQIKNGIRVIHKNVYTTGRPRIVVQLKPNTTYTYSQNEVAGYSILPDGGTIKYASTNQMTVTTGNLGILTIEYIVDSNSTREYTNIQLEEGSTATPYTPHQEQTFTFPLGNEKLMLGDYLADDGIHHVRKQIVLDGTEPWQQYGNNVYFQDINRIHGKPTSGNIIGGFCTHTDVTTRTNMQYNSPSGVGLFVSNLISYWGLSEVSVNAWETWLSTHNVTVEYELAEEQIVPYTSAQQKIYNEIKNAYSYDEMTIITGSSDGNKPFFIVQAYKDLNKELNNKVDKVQGKELSSNDFTDVLKEKLEGLENYDDTEIKADISDIQDEQIEQNTDIEKLQTENARLKATLPTTGEVTGQDVTLDKTAEMEFVKPPLPMGNSEQVQYSGKNLFDIDSGLNNVLIKNNDKYTMTKTSSSRFANEVPCNIEAGTYIWQLNLLDSNLAEYGSDDKTIQLVVTYEDDSGTTLGMPGGISNGFKSREVQFSKNVKSLKLYMEGGFTNGAYATFNNFMISINGGEYEPYVGGTASPNPDYPQEITNVTGDVEVVVQNKNHAKNNSGNLTRNGITFIKNNAGSITANGTATADSFYVLREDLSFKKGETYTLSGCNGGSLSTYYMYCYNIGEVTNGSKTSTLNKDFINRQLGIVIKSGYTANNLKFYPQLEKNSTSTPFTPHKEQVFTFPLGNEKLMLGDYLADDGIHHVKWQDIFDGDENLIYNSGSKLFIFYTTQRIKTWANPICNYFTQSSKNKQLYIQGSNSTGEFWLFDKDGYFEESVAKLKEWLLNKKQKGNALVAEYPLKQEVIVPYTSAQQEVYNQIKQTISYEEQTNISSNTIALFNVEAYQSTKLVLEEMATAIVALGGV